ncbi:hypothetical protein [Natronorubrum bangense]|uniref:Uncharacterized protein n=2 Tax=Natronorubrum bangense TaxID=61858 RepID=L9WNG1_9EURY|nr:hypothetical protein [Natronorubrum bangense]ELY49888.1 hypothetical protein C494_07755 [Natronorubrum bangense JCM 10635]QCC55507.1 hypothetical protein DV706_14130 [Natronorubrum bangense]
MKKIELETPIDEMSEADLRETFSQVMDAHEENITAYSELEETAGKATEYAEHIEDLESDLEAARAYFSEKASTVTNIDQELLAQRFSMGELVEMTGRADEAAEARFSEEQEATEQEADEGAVDEPETVFADKPQKSPAFSSDALESRKEAARARLSSVGGISL